MNDRLVRTFCSLVSLASESGSEHEFIQYLKGILTDEFHAECTIDHYGNLIARIPAKMCSIESPVFFGVHADTVRPGIGIKPVVLDGVIRPESDTVLGADDKAGIAELLEAMRRAKRRPPIEIVVTREEELGFLGARQVDTSQLKSHMGFVLDADELNSVIIKSPTHMFIDIDVTGRAAHAGVEPEKGISAIEVSAHAISILKVGRVDEETTLNFGLIQGGEIRNGVPEKVKLLGEARSLDHQKCLLQGELVEQAFQAAARALGATVSVNKEVSYRAASLSEEAEPVRIAFEAIRRSGLEPKYRVVCAGTEASVYNDRGLMTAVLGQGVHNVHSKNEHIYVSDMEKAVEVLLNVFEVVCEGS